MKLLFTILAFICINLNLFSQDASTFFPSSIGFKWTYKEIPLDSSNNEVDTVIYQIDSFAVVQNYKGKNASVILSKTGDISNVVNAPFSDTNYVNFEGSDANFYFELFNVDSVLNGSSKKELGTSLRKIFKPNFEGWYSFYRFAQPENQSYDIFSVDSTLIIDSTELDIRFTASGMRMGDENVQTEIGNFDTKKFVIDNAVFLLFGSLSIPVFTITDTVWMAPGNWIVKEVVPSNLVDLSFAGAGTIFIPGYKRNVTNPIVTAIDNNTNSNPVSFSLFQNYPNPFNPSTTIRYEIGRTTNVKLKIYNVLGNEVTELINKIQSAGEYKIQFNPSKINGGLSSGVYFYSLQAGSKSLIKKLIYLK